MAWAEKPGNNASVTAVWCLQRVSKGRLVLGSSSMSFFSGGSYYKLVFVGFLTLFCRRIIRTVLFLLIVL